METKVSWPLDMNFRAFVIVSRKTFIDVWLVIQLKVQIAYTCEQVYRRSEQLLCSPERAFDLNRNESSKPLCRKARGRFWAGRNGPIYQHS